MTTEVKPRYLLPTGRSLLANKCLEMMYAHTRGKDYKYDEQPLYHTAEAIADQNTIIIVATNEQGLYGEEDNLL